MANVYCDKVAPGQYRIPRMTDTAAYWKPINLKHHDWDFKEVRIGYTVSFWLKNEGTGVFTANPKPGRDATFLIKI